MGIAEGDTNVTATISQALRNTLEKAAHKEGLSLSRFAAAILGQHAMAELIVDQPLKVRTMDNRGRIKLPAELVAALDLQPTTPLAIFPFHRGALIRPVR